MYDKIDALLDRVSDAEMKVVYKAAVQLKESKKKTQDQVDEEAEPQTNELLRQAEARECDMVRPRPTATTVSWRRPKLIQSPVTQKRA